MIDEKLRPAFHLRCLVESWLIADAAATRLSEDDVVTLLNDADAFTDAFVEQLGNEVSYDDGDADVLITTTRRVLMSRVSRLFADDAALLARSFPNVSANRLAENLTMMSGVSYVTDGLFRVWSKRDPIGGGWVVSYDYPYLVDGTWSPRGRSLVVGPDEDIATEFSNFVWRGTSRFVDMVSADLLPTFLKENESDDGMAAFFKRLCTGYGSAAARACVIPIFDPDAVGPPPIAAMRSLEWWRGLRRLDGRALQDLGMRIVTSNVDGSTFGLFPAAWYSHIPDGLVVTAIDGSEREFFRSYAPLTAEGHLQCGVPVRRSQENLN